MGVSAMYAAANLASCIALNHQVPPQDTTGRIAPTTQSILCHLSLTVQPPTGCIRPCLVHSRNMSRATYQESVRHAVSFVQAHKPGCQQKSFPSPDLCGMVCDKEMELLIPNRGFVAAPVAGGSILAAAHHLRAQAQPAVGVALPGEPPHRQVACLHQVYLDIKRHCLW